jgi:hypothetical protein
MKGLYLLASVALLASPAFAITPKATKDVPKDKDAYIAKTLTAAPEAVSKNATIVRVNDTFDITETLQKGTNNFTCGIEPDSGNPFCADEYSMRWYKAAYSNGEPPPGFGLAYMQGGDTGVSNHDPAATDHSHWVEAPQHIMLLGPGVKELAASYPRTLDPDPMQPFVMFPGHKLEHLMIPVDREPGGTQ